MPHPGVGEKQARTCTHGEDRALHVRGGAVAAVAITGTKEVLYCE